MCLLLLIASLLGLIAWSGGETGTDTILPGPMSRSRDSIAIAQSFLKERRWLGFTAYKEVLLELDRKGLTLDTNIAKRTFGTTDYQSFLRRPDIVNAAIHAAAETEVRHPEELWFVDGDDVGMASYFILAFALFGDNVSSLFYLYLTILVVAVTAYCLQFRRLPEVLVIAVLFLITIHALLTVTLGITPDVNTLHSSRFLSVLGILSALHLVLLMMYRTPFTAGTAALATVQIIALVFIIHCRTTGAWLLMAIVGAAGVLFVLFRPHGSRGWAGAALAFKQSVAWAWPLLILIPALLLSMSAVHLLKHPTYNEPDSLGRHVFWHAFITVLHNNPHRTEVFGLEKTPMLDPRGDGISFHLFEEYIKRKGLDRAEYVSHDAKRNLLVGIDYIWHRYDSVLSSVFWESVKKEPWYAIVSFFYYQPIDVIRTLLKLTSRTAGTILSFQDSLALILALLLFQSDRRLLLSGMLGLVMLFSFVPSMAVAPQELRLMEPFAMFLITLGFGALAVTTGLMDALRWWFYKQV